MRQIKELISLQNRTAIITGCNGPMGITIAETLAELGCNLICIDKPQTKTDKLINTLNSYQNISYKFIEFDFEDINSRRKLIEKIINENKKVDILINNAAMTGSSNLKGWVTNFQEQDINVWQKAMEINVTSIFHICRDLSKTLSANKKGSIINISSIYGACAPDYSLYQDTDMNNPAAYAVSKGALIQFTRWLASTLAPNVRVNCISPGGVFNDQNKLFVDKYSLRTPLNRMANYEDFKGIIAFLSSDLSEYVTGQNIFIDGGWSI